MEEVAAVQEAVETAAEVAQEVVPEVAKKTNHKAEIAIGVGIVVIGGIIAYHIHKKTKARKKVEPAVQETKEPETVEVVEEAAKESTETKEPEKMN